MKNLEKLSRLRKQIVKLERKYASIVRSIVKERGPTIKGLFRQHGTRCGKPNCRCTKGELHTTAVLSFTEQGKQKNIYVRYQDRERVKRFSKKYQSFRQKRAEMVKIANEIVGLSDQILKMLLEPYVPPIKKK